MMPLANPLEPKLSKHNSSCDNECRSQTELSRHQVESPIKGLPPATKQSFGPDQKKAVPGVFESRYELGEPLGGGGSGQVFRVRKLMAEPGGSVELACKIVDWTAEQPPDLNSRQWANAKARKAWKLVVTSITNELTIWEDIKDHPFILPLLESFREKEGKIHFVMPYATDGALFAYPVEMLSLDQVLVFIVQIMEGIMYMHDKDIVHRDLKPDNILITFKDGRMKAMVADFGQSGRGSTFKGRAGTRGWRAPEVVSGQAYDKKVDSYGIGLLLWWMLFDCIIYSKDSSWEVIPEKFPRDAVRITSFLSTLLTESPDERWTVEAARRHPLVRDVKIDAPATPDEPIAESAALSNDDSVTSPVAALSAPSTVVPPVEPMENAPVAIQLSEDIVAAMLLSGDSTSISETSGTPDFPPSVDLISGKRKREVSTSEVVIEETLMTKRQKASQSAIDAEGKEAWSFDRVREGVASHIKSVWSATLRLGRRDAA
ncbi:Calcium/calmodulin-dependent protein kinase type IV [Tulasnella sp. JGI-2019a]|nr:Calcium/calmodulin-dependent protein kinase type IV [Tulasnella sp. JGI-2019a]